MSLCKTELEMLPKGVNMHVQNFGRTQDKKNSALTAPPTFENKPFCARQTLGENSTHAEHNPCMIIRALPDVVSSVRKPDSAISPEFRVELFSHVRFASTRRLLQHRLQGNSWTHFGSSLCCGARRSGSNIFHATVGVRLCMGTVFKCWPAFWHGMATFVVRRI